MYYYASSIASGRRVKRGSHPSGWALQALVHPVSLCCLALLWLNDQVLKVRWPDWVTGKLSDVAGLAFFPLLLSVLLGLARRSPKATIVSSTLLTGSWFAAAKTVPAVADATERLVEALSGQPARIVTDPTDLVALPALGWALIAWRQPRSAGALSASRLAVLVAAASLSLATSMDCPAHAPQDLTVFEPGVVVADTTPNVMSTDAGRTWRTVDDAAARRLVARTHLEDRDCFPADPAHCFWVDPEAVAVAQVEESVDGGVSWEPVWSYPQHRLQFVGRHEEARCGYSVFPGDLVVLERPEPVVLVTMADHGIVRRGADGEWTTPDLGIESVGLPTAALGRNIAPELVFAFSGGYIFYAVLSLVAWSRLRRSARSARWGVDGYAARIGRVVWELGAAAGVCFILVASAALPIVRVVIPLIVLGAAVVGILRLAWFDARWSEVVDRHPCADMVASLRRRTMWSAIGFGAAVATAALAWSGGLIARLEAAYGAMATATAAIAVIWWITMGTALARATTCPPATTAPDPPDGALGGHDVA
jgi:hypothetical protein